MNNSIQAVVDDLTKIFQATNDALNEWQGEGNLQFPALVAVIAVKLNWDDKQLREADPIVRYYVRKHPDWYVTRGAHGGIMRISDKQKKEAAVKAKASVKDQMRAAIEAKAALAAQTPINVTTTSATADSDSDSDSDE